MIEQKNTVREPNKALEQNFKNDQDNSVKELGSILDLVDECPR